MASDSRLGLPFKIFCRADEDYCVTVRDDEVVLAPANPADDYQVYLVTPTKSWCSFASVHSHFTN
jgi:hypothetical protein